MEDLSKFVPGTPEVDQTAPEQEAEAGAEKAPNKRGRKKGTGEGKKKQKPPKEPKPRRDNLAEIDACNSLRALRKKLQIAIAKKAKSAGRAEAEARYQLEIDACREKLSVFSQSLEGLKGPELIARLKELDEEDNKIITHYIATKEAEFENWAEAAGAKIPKPLLREESAAIPEVFVKELGEELSEALIARHERSDHRFLAICRKFNFVKAVEKGGFVIQNGKFVDPSKVKAEVAPTTEA